ncbi:MAG: CapA family protein, partial [Acidaminococcaceae bacterium]|nr:CapA family protein [Acidaminococcaceae bacterium]
MAKFFKLFFASLLLLCVSFCFNNFYGTAYSAAKAGEKNIPSQPAVENEAVKSAAEKTVAADKKNAAEAPAEATVKSAADKTALPSDETLAKTGEKPTPPIVRKSVKISAVGDCTIGWDDRYAPGNRFDAYLYANNGDYGYYLAKVRDVFRDSDFTIANLEGTFTSYNVKEEKTFNFSAPE